MWLPRPLIRCFACIRRQWDIQNTLVDASASFFLLSYVKFASASLDILMPCSVWNSSATLQWLVVYYDGTGERAQALCHIQFFWCLHCSTYYIFASILVVVFNCGDNSTDCHLWRHYPTPSLFHFKVHLGMVRMGQELCICTPNFSSTGLHVARCINDLSK